MSVNKMVDSNRTILTIVAVVLIIIVIIVIAYSLLREQNTGPRNRGRRRGYRGHSSYRNKFTHSKKSSKHGGSCKCQTCTKKVYHKHECNKPTPPIFDCQGWFNGQLNYQCGVIDQSDFSYHIQWHPISDTKHPIAMYIIYYSNQNQPPAGPNNYVMKWQVPAYDTGFITPELGADSLCGNFTISAVNECGEGPTSQPWFTQCV